MEVYLLSNSFEHALRPVIEMISYMNKLHCTSRSMNRSNNLLPIYRCGLWTYGPPNELQFASQYSINFQFHLCRAI